MLLGVQRTARRAFATKQPEQNKYFKHNLVEGIPEAEHDIPSAEFLVNGDSRETTPTESGVGVVVAWLRSEAYSLVSGRAWVAHCL